MAAHPYIGAACSSALRLGLHCRPLESLPLTDEQRRARLRAFITIQQLDVYSGLVLGTPPFMNLRGAQEHPSSPDSDLSPIRSISGNTSREDLIGVELSFQHLQLLNITASGLNAVFPQFVGLSEPKDGDETFAVNVKHLEEVGDQFQAWARKFSSFLRRTSDVAGYEM